MSESEPKRMKKNSGSTAKSQRKAKAASLPAPDPDVLKYLNKEYLSEENAQKIKAEFSKQTPFPHSGLPNFLDDAFLRNVKEQLTNGEEWFVKNNDLYSFAQTDALQNSDMSYIKAMNNIIYSSEFRKFISTVTGVELNNTVDIFGSRYWRGSTLLCHDDELEGRRVAFIFYLVPEDWKKEDGGALDLFDVDAEGQPNKVVVSKVPRWNSFLFFEVSPVSFHQVAEVLAEEKERVAISGWFHGAPIKRPPRYVEPDVTRIVPADFKPSKKIALANFINPKYLQAATQKKVRAYFEQNSSIELQDFLLKNTYKELFAALKDSKAPFKLIGPANRRQYHSIGRGTVEGTTGPIRNILELFYSSEFVRFLVKITGLDIVSCSMEARKFANTCYTLAQDNAEHQKESGLDAIYHLCDLKDPDDGWFEEEGGMTTYMTEEEELITVVPSPNSFSLVYRAGGDRVMRFVKYLRTGAPELYSIAGVYHDPPSENQEDDAMDEDAALELPPGAEMYIPDTRIKTLEEAEDDDDDDDDE